MRQYFCRAIQFPFAFIPTIAVTLFSGIIKSPSVKVTPMFLVTESAGKISRWSFKGKSP